MQVIARGSRVYAQVWTAAVCFAVLLSSAFADGQISTETGQSKSKGERSGHYLMIIPSGYVGSTPMLQFASAKTAQGFDITTYAVPSGTSKETIKSYIESVWNSQTPPKYILIVGDTAGSYNSTATTIPHWLGGGSKNAPTDLPYACMDEGDDWYPDIAIGRFSVGTISDLQDVVDKSLFVEAGDFPDPEYAKRGAFLANPGTVGQAEPTHDWVIDNYFTPNDYEGVKLYSADGAGTSDVTAAVNDGCLWVGYFGHSGSSGWWDPSFDQGDVQNLSNQGLYGVAWSFSCNVGNYTISECFGETWLREADKGAAAVIFPSAYIYWGSVSAWEPSVVLEKSFFRAFFEDDVWEVGPAWQKGLSHFLHDSTSSTDVKRNFYELYNLLGDPSLLLPQPNGFSLSGDPASVGLCCPPDNQAVYTIEMGQMGDFSETIVLSVDGEPAGATVDFSVNSQPPPFTSVLTLGNLSSGSIGDYNVVITGTSASQVRTTSVGLSIAAGIPGPATLLDPLDGASGVELLPELSWEPVSGATAYDLQIATDSGFVSVVYTATATGTSHTVETPLGTLTPYFWRVRGTNICGDGDYCSAFSFTTLNMVMPDTYDMLNGETGSYTYFDDPYDGLGDPTVPLDPLSDGLGELVDGVIATEHWNVDNDPYVGWSSIEPTITFHFADTVNIDVVTIHVDDTGGGGGVVPPSDVAISMGGVDLTFPVTDPAGSEPFAFSFTDLGLSGDSLEMTLEDDDFTTSRYIMLTEVKFFGSPPITGACCAEGACTMRTELECLALDGEYQGDDTTCDPDPCGTPEPTCLIISEVVHGAESGGCPRFIEITNTGLTDFTFTEGGVIVQTDDSTDVTVDMDLTGVTISAGQAFVVESTLEGGPCIGAFNFIFGFPADFSMAVEVGDGDARYIITDTADGSNLLDIYGEFGVDGTGEDWEYTEGYSYRLPAYNAGSGQTFAPGEWFFGGVGSLAVPGDPSQHLRDFTTPKTHVYDEDCVAGPAPGDINDDGSVDLDDFSLFFACLAGPDNPTPPKTCDPVENFASSDLEGDNDVDLFDFGIFVTLFD